MGCGFSTQVVSIDAALDDVVGGDGEPSTFPACTVHRSGPTTDGAAIGGGGGDPQMDTTCTADELPIGLGFVVSSDGIPSHADQLAMVNLRVRCGRITRHIDGTFGVQPGTQVSRPGGMGGNCSAYFPTVVAPEATCAPGSVLVGVTGNRIDSSLYNTVSIVCAPLAPDATIMSGRTTLMIAGTGNETNQPQTSGCADGFAVATFGLRSGCGQDQLTPRCTPVACD
jgi:hypothetical protein